MVDDRETMACCKSCRTPIPEGATDCPACAQPGSSETSLPPPTLPGFTMLRLLGRGGMGRVYLAEDERLGRRVAIKVLSESYADDRRAERFLREARTMASVEHPNIVGVHSCGEADGRLFLVMQYVEGETLAQRITRQGRFPLDVALGVTSSIARALEAAWRKRIVHRDIKPSNILFDRDGQVRVADFGLAKPLSGHGDASLTGDGLAVGTPNYLSPEQALGQPLDFRTDIYSLGVVLFEMLAGRVPFHGMSPIDTIHQHIHQPLPRLADEHPDVPEKADALVRWMTEKDPDRRPAAYADLLARIEAMDALQPQQTATQVPTAPVPRVPTARVMEWLSAGVQADASEIHLVAARQGYSLRYRVQGRLHDQGQPEREQAGDLIRELEALAPMQATPAGAREGSLALSVEGQELTLGISVVPSPHGEICVVALNRATSRSWSLAEMRLPRQSQDRLSAAVRMNGGLIVMAGPTGSGKVTTLWALLQLASSRNLATYHIGDPELDGLYEQPSGLDRVQHVHLHRGKGADLHAVLDSVYSLRPDVVGVMADAAKDDIDHMLWLASRGLTIVMQLSAASVLDAMRRLQRVQSEHLAHGLGCLAAQILVHKLCSCRQPTDAFEAELRQAGLAADEAARATCYTPAGCPRCENSGYRGRIPVTEVAPMTPTLRERLGAGMTPEAFKQAAVDAGMLSLRQLSLRLVLEGQTSLAKVLAATPADTA